MSLVRKHTGYIQVAGWARTVRPRSSKLKISDIDFLRGFPASLFPGWNSSKLTRHRQVPSQTLAAADAYACCRDKDSATMCCSSLPGSQKSHRVPSEKTCEAATSLYLESAALAAHLLLVSCSEPSELRIFRREDRLSETSPRAVDISVILRCLLAALSASPCVLIACCSERIEKGELENCGNQ